MQCNSSTSGFNVTRDLQGYSSKNMTHTVLPKLMAWPWDYSNSPAEYCSDKRVSKGTTYISSFNWRSSTISQPNGCWFSQERRPEIKFLLKKGWSTQRNQRMECPYPHKRWDNLVSQLWEVSPTWIVLSHHWHHKNWGERSSQKQLMITTNWWFSWQQNTVKYQQDTVTNPRVKCQRLVITT